MRDYGKKGVCVCVCTEFVTSQVHGFSRLKLLPESEIYLGHFLL
jgi:hypothetical protein